MGFWGWIGAQPLGRAPANFVKSTLKKTEVLNLCLIINIDHILVLKQESHY